MSGVLATVVTGIYLGTRTAGLLQARSRASATMFWRTLVFLLESALFVLLGLELRSVVGHLSDRYSVPWLAGAAAAVVAAVIGIRLAWELLISPLLSFLPGRHSAYVRNPWRQRLIVGWGGLRGAISLARRPPPRDPAVLSSPLPPPSTMQVSVTRLLSEVRTDRDLDGPP